MTESNELVVVEPKNIPALFAKDGCDPLLARIKEEVRQFEPDMTTAGGRKEIASLAHKVAKSKTYLDSLGKDLVTEIKEKAKVIDGERKKVRDELDALKEEVRKPLTEWEEAEKERVARHEDAIQLINETLELPIEDSSHALRVIEYLKGIIVDEAFEEFELAATKAKESALTQLEAKFIVLQNAEKEQAEAERLEKERIEKEQKEREERIAKEAAEKAKKEAEEKAKAEAEEKDRAAKEAIEKAEKEKLEAQLEAEKKENEKKEAAERAERDKKEAAEKADREKQEAIDAEKKRIEDESEAERKEAEKKAANKAHRGKINRAAKKSLVSEGFKEDEAEKIITLVAQGKIEHITINY